MQQKQKAHQLQLIGPLASRTAGRQGDNAMFNYKCKWAKCKAEYVSKAKLEYTGCGDGFPPTGWATVWLETNEIPMGEIASLICPEHVREIGVLLGMTAARGLSDPVAKCSGCCGPIWEYEVTPDNPCKFGSRCLCSECQAEGVEQAAI